MTGVNYMRLNIGESIKGLFQPKIQTTDYFST